MVGVRGPSTQEKRETEPSIFYEIYQVKTSLKEFSKTRYSPNSGYEQPYEPYIWDTDKISLSTNCWAYVLNIMHGFEKYDKLNPGKISGIEYNDGDIKSFLNVIEQDIKCLGGFIKPVKFEDKCPVGSYKIAIVVDYREVIEDGIKKKIIDDFHFYRQNPDATWSHKQGFGRVNDTDASGNKIINPKRADRDYRWRVSRINEEGELTEELEGRNLNIFLGYFALKALPSTDYNEIIRIKEVQK